MTPRTKPEGYTEFDECIAPLLLAHGEKYMHFVDNGWDYLRFDDGVTVKLDSVFVDNDRYCGHYYAVLETIKE